MVGNPTRTATAKSRSAPSRRIPPRRKKNRNWRLRLAFLAGAAVAGLFGWAVLERHIAPAGNTKLDRFDAIIVLGNPAMPTATPRPPSWPA